MNRSVENMLGHINGIYDDIWDVQLMLHLIAKSLALVDNIIYQVHPFWRYISVVVLLLWYFGDKPVFYDGYPSCKMSLQQWCNNLDI